MNKRIPLLKRIDELNKQLGFVGSRNEQCLTDDRLEILCVELEEEVKSKKR